MPTVEKTHGGRVYVRLVGQAFEIGDRADVSDAEAQYLVEERGDFEIVDDGENRPDDETNPESEWSVDHDNEDAPAEDAATDDQDDDTEEDDDVDDASVGTEIANEHAGGVAPPFDPSEYTVDELRDELDGADYGGSELHALAAAEERGKDRTTALEAIDAHIPNHETDGAGD